jgi:hypothetical protein
MTAREGDSWDQAWAPILLSIEAAAVGAAHSWSSQ